MLPTDPRTPGLYYWCPITGDGNGIDIVRKPQLLRLLPGGICAEAVVKSGLPRFDAPFRICDVLWFRFALTEEEAVERGYLLLNERSRAHHDATVGSNTSTSRYTVTR